MPNKSWKRTEREIAARLGGKRVPVSGRQRGDAPDIEHEWLSIEVKHRQTLPGWLHDAMDQARKSMRGEQLPIVVLHERGKLHDANFVVVPLGEFVEWFGNLPEAGDEREN